MARSSAVRKESTPPPETPGRESYEYGDEGEASLTAERLAGRAGEVQSDVAAKTDEVKEGAAKIETVAGGKLTDPEQAANLHLVTDAEAAGAEAAAKTGAIGSEAKKLAAEESPEETPAEVALEEQMLVAGRDLAVLEAKFGRSKKPEDAEALAEARQVYGEKRLEYVGGNIERFVVSQKKQIEARREALIKEKGWLGKACDAYKKLGALNLEKAGWKPQGKVGKIIAKMVSVRTGIMVGLLAGSAIAGAGTASAIGLLALRRALSGAGAAIATFDLAKNFSEARLRASYSPDKVADMNDDEVTEGLERFEASALTGGRSLEGDVVYDALMKECVKRNQGRELGKEEMRGVMMGSEAGVEVHRQAAQRSNVKKGVVAGLVGAIVGSGALARIFRHGTHLAGQKLGLSTDAAKNIGHAGEAAAAAKAMTASAAGEVTTAPGAGVAHEAIGANAENMPGVAAPHEVAPGSGVLANDAQPQFRVVPEGGIKAANSLTAEARSVAEITPEGEIKILHPEAVAAPPSAESIHASQIIRGDSYTKVIRRDLLADPKRFGFDPEHDGDVNAWAKKTGAEILRKNGLVAKGREMRLLFDAKHPGRVSLNMHDGQIGVEKTGVKDYVFKHHAVAPVEAHAAAEPEMPKIIRAENFDKAVTIETPTGKFTGLPELTGEHIQGHTGAAESQLGTLIHEFKIPLKPVDLRDAAINAGGKFGTGTLKDENLIMTIFRDRTGQLHALKEGYLEAHRQGQTALETRLFTDYNAVVHEANGKIGNIFKELQPVKGSDLAASVAETHAGVAGAAAEAKLSGVAEVIKTPGGSKIEFLHNAAGKLTGVKVDANMIDPAKAQRMMGGDWLKRATDNYTGKETDIGRFRTGIIGKVQELLATEKAATDLAKMHAPEEQVDIVKQKAVLLARGIKKTYGDIFRKSA
jgi:hypothetical protein